MWMACLWKHILFGAHLLSSAARKRDNSVRISYFEKVLEAGQETASQPHGVGRGSCLGSAIEIYR